jgi:Helix-turn-helix domain
VARMLSDLPSPRTELRRAILDSGLPAWKIGYLAELTPTVLSHICTGRRDPQPAEAERLAEVLEADVAELFPDLGAVAV